MFGPLDKLAAPRNFYRVGEALLPWLMAALVAGVLAGLYLGLWAAPSDYLQGNSYRIMFIHVPAAWLSMLVYTLMALAAAIGLVWRLKLTFAFTRAAAPAGAVFTLVTLVTGAVWGKPTWGSWWVWDARLTSELILLFLYLGYIALQEATSSRRAAWRNGAILLVAGFVNIPVIHYSVVWWHTLHQPASILKFDTPSIHPSMLAPLVVMAAAFVVLAAITIIQRMQALLLEESNGQAWVRELAPGRRRQEGADG